MTDDKKLSELVTRLRDSASDNLESVVLFGSAASGQFHPHFSDINLLCIFADLSVPALEKLAPTIRWWMRKNPAPLLFTREELTRSADLFAIEFVDIQQQHQVLFGQDPFIGLHIPMDLQRKQLQHELRTKLLLLRERFVTTDGSRRKMMEVLLHSLPNFLTLFRHSLMAIGEEAPTSWRDILDASAAKFGFDKSLLVQLLEIRERKRDTKSVNASATFAHYFDAIERVLRKVDTR